MRKITALATAAFYGSYDFNRDNTRVEPGTDGTVALYLHGHRIAERFHDGSIMITDAGQPGDSGRPSQVTKERLNGILARKGRSIYQKQFEWFIIGPDHSPDNDTTAPFPFNEWVRI